MAYRDFFVSIFLFIIDLAYKAFVLFGKKRGGCFAGSEHHTIEHITRIGFVE